MKPPEEYVPACCHGYLSGCPWCELAAMRARVAELEKQVAEARTESAALLTAVREIESGCSCELVTIGAYCERFGDKPIAVHPDRLDGIWRAIKERAQGAMTWAAGALASRARCEQLEQQVATLADALEEVAPDPLDSIACSRVHHAKKDRHKAMPCPVALRAQAELRAAGRKT